MCTLAMVASILHISFACENRTSNTNEIINESKVFQCMQSFFFCFFTFYYTYMFKNKIKYLTFLHFSFFVFFLQWTIHHTQWEISEKIYFRGSPKLWYYCMLDSSDQFLISFYKLRMDRRIYGWMDKSKDGLMDQSMEGWIN